MRNATITPTPCHWSMNYPAIPQYSGINKTLIKLFKDTNTKLSIDGQERKFHIIVEPTDHNSPACSKMFGFRT